MSKASRSVTAYLTGTNPDRAELSPDVTLALAPDVDSKVMQAADLLGASDDEEVLKALRQVAKEHLAP